MQTKRAHKHAQHDQSTHGNWADQAGGEAESQGKTADEKMEWRNRVNVTFWDKLTPIEHGGDLLNAAESIPWEGEESFLNRFQSKQSVTEPPKAKRDQKHPLSKSNVMREIAGWVKENRGATAIPASSLFNRLGVSERELDRYVYSDWLRGFMQWEKTHGLNQLRLRSTRGYRFDSNNGIVTEAQALQRALRKAGYRFPDRLLLAVNRLDPTTTEKEALDLIPDAADLIDDELAAGSALFKQALQESALQAVAEKHLAGQHPQDRHGWRYGQGRSLSALRRQRRGQGAQEWDEYKKRARGDRGATQPKPEPKPQPAKSPYTKEQQKALKDFMAIKEELNEYHMRVERLNTDIADIDDEIEKYKKAEDRAGRLAERNREKYHEYVGAGEDSKAEGAHKRFLKYTKERHDAQESRRKAMENRRDLVYDRNHDRAVLDEAAEIYTRDPDGEQALFAVRDIYTKEASKMREQLVEHFLGPDVFIPKDELQVRSDKIGDQMSAIRGKYAEWEDFNAAEADNERWHELYKEKNRLDHLIKDDYYHVGSDKVREVLYNPEDRSTRVDFEITGSGGRRQDITEGVEAFGRLVTRNRFVEGRRVRIDKQADDDRAHYNESMGKVQLYRGDYADTVVHELGHFLEHSDPFIGRLARDFLARRTAGERRRSLKELTGKSYDADEYTKPDKFIEPYMGKFYLTGSTEILSMGLEMFYKNPLRLARLDPEYFDFILGVVRMGGL